jgi:hypothetical protein
LYFQSNRSTASKLSAPLYMQLDRWKAIEFFAIHDGAGKVINGKRTPAVHMLRSSFDLNLRTVSLKTERVH